VFNQRFTANANVDLDFSLFTTFDFFAIM